MDEKTKSFPNVSLGGKKSKQRGDVDSGELRYGRNHETERNNEKK
ncbi:hypothetical protein RCG23_00780 [Neobacillus sp. PS3-34]|nr:hypothetical protein [Neobacillus sp. PS3-34]WML48716.1 hypothetical protein RCG23_00780 [Neobacillus sp. PS3-34]